MDLSLGQALDPDKELYKTIDPCWHLDLYRERDQDPDRDPKPE